MIKHCDCKFRFRNMHHVVKITCPVSDEALDAACARAAKDAAACGLPFAESCEYNKVCRSQSDACFSSNELPLNILTVQIPIQIALRAVLNPSAPPISALEIGSGTAQHALHLLSHFTDESGPTIARFFWSSPQPHPFFIPPSPSPHVLAPDGNSVKCPGMVQTLPSARCRLRAKSTRREWPCQRI
jgi:hypothetical protein